MLVSADEVDTLAPGAGPVIVALPGAGLAQAVQLMQRSECVAGAMFAEKQLVIPEGFGLDKLIGSESPIHTCTVGTYADKTRCMATIAAFVESIGAPRNYREPIAQCVDEMLMNALYDAPVDKDGVHIFTGIPTRDRITMRTDARVVVQYAYHGRRFAVAIRDAFGSLDRATVLRFLDKALHANDVVDRKVGGAGLGLYLVATAATGVVFNVVRGVATEVACVFDFGRPKPALEYFAVVVHDEAGELVGAGPARRIVVTPLRVWLVRGALCVVAIWVVVLGVLAYSRFVGNTARLVFTTARGATIELDGHAAGTAADGMLEVDGLPLDRAYRVVAHLDGYEPSRMIVKPHAGRNDIPLVLVAVATVDVDTRPSDALVELDGKVVGSTPLTLTTLAPETSAAITFRRPGYHPATAHIPVPKRGQRMQLVRDLEVADDLVLVHFNSNPPGATIVRDGETPGANRTYTPADVYVEAEKVQRFTLLMPMHAPLVIAPFTPERGSTALEKGGALIAR